MFSLKPLIYLMISSLPDWFLRYGKQPKLIALVFTQGQHINFKLKQIAHFFFSLLNSWRFCISFSFPFLYYKKKKKKKTQGRKSGCNPQVKILDVELEMNRTKGFALRLMQLPSLYIMTSGKENFSYQKVSLKEGVVYGLNISNSKSELFLKLFHFFFPSDLYAIELMYIKNL